MERFQQLEADQIEWERVIKSARKAEKKLKLHLFCNFDGFCTLPPSTVVHAEKSKNTSLNETCGELRQQVEQTNLKVTKPLQYYGIPPINLLLFCVHYRFPH